MVQTINNPDGTVSIIHVDPTNAVVTLPDGTQAQVQAVSAVSISVFFLRHPHLIAVNCVSSVD